MIDLARENVSAITPAYPFAIGTERIPEQEFQRIFRYVQLIPLWSVTAQGKKYKFPKPIMVKIYLEDNLFFAESETLVVVGTGESITEAIDDLGKQIIHFYKYYKNLSRDKRHWQSFYLILSFCGFKWRELEIEVTS